MNPQELVISSEQILKAGAALSAAFPFTALVKRMLGPAVDEIADRVRDEVRLYRYGRQLSMLKKAEGMAIRAGYTPKAVPLKSLFALLEGASLEESENLHTMWAALLANAAHPDSGSSVRPSFMDTLRLLTPEVGLFLDAVYTKALTGSASIETNFSPYSLAHVDLGTYDALYAVFAEAGCTVLPAHSLITAGSAREELHADELDRQRFDVLMDELNRYQMWSVSTGRSSGSHYYLSAYAVHFLQATHPPKDGMVSRGS